MIPTMMVFGLILGRWWRLALISAAAVWPILLWVTGVFAGLDYTWWQFSGLLLTTALLGAVNAGVGVAVHQGVLYVIRSVLRQSRANPAGADW